MRTAAETVRDHPGLQFSFYLETVRLYRCFFFHIYVKEINCRRSVKGEDMKKRIVTQDYGRSAISLAHWIDFAGILCILIGPLFKWINYYN